MEVVEDQLQKAKVNHNQSLPEDKLTDIKKAIMLYRDVKQRENEHLKQIELCKDLQEAI